MNWYEILIIVCAAGFVAAVVIWQVIRKLHGKSGCDCGCANCSGCSACRAKKKEDK